MAITLKTSDYWWCFMDSLFEYKDAEYKVYTEVISCNNKELCVNQYIDIGYDAWWLGTLLESQIND